jgi:glyoxylase-like metal-dependent hydrolase (beta-lactamase superfamily II)
MQLVGEAESGKAAISVEEYVPQRDGGYLDLIDGQVFDLGGVTLQAIAVPSHTQGMIGVKS